MLEKLVEKGSLIEIFQRTDQIRCIQSWHCNTDLAVSQVQPLISDYITHSLTQSFKVEKQPSASPTQRSVLFYQPKMKAGESFFIIHLFIKVII